MVKNKLENDLSDVEAEKTRLEKLRQDIAHTQQKAVEKAHAAAMQLQKREKQLEVRSVAMCLLDSCHLIDSLTSLKQSEHERLVSEKGELAQRAVSSGNLVVGRTTFDFLSNAWLPARTE